MLLKRADWQGYEGLGWGIQIHLGYRTGGVTGGESGRTSLSCFIVLLCAGSGHRYSFSFYHQKVSALEHLQPILSTFILQKSHSTSLESVTSQSWTQWICPWCYQTRL